MAKSRSAGCVGVEGGAMQGRARLRSDHVRIETHLDACRQGQVSLAAILWGLNMPVKHKESNLHAHKGCI